MLSQAFGCIARDRGNTVVILTGTGDVFTGPRASPETFPLSTPRSWERIQANQFDLTWNLLAIDAPVISCVNGPAWRHPEIPLLGDVVLACEEASFQDSAHFANRTVPGDGINLFMPLLLGLNRGRYFLLTGQELSARVAHEMGLVSEMVPREGLEERANEIADRLVQQNPLVLRYTRRLLMQPLKELTLRHLGYGAALEGLAAIDETEVRRY